MATVSPSFIQTHLIRKATSYCEYIKSWISAPNINHWLINSRQECTMRTSWCPELENRIWCNRNTLNCTFVNTTPNAEEALLAPCWTPAVLDRPEFLFRRFVHTIADQQHSMISQLEWIEAIAKAWNLNIIKHEQTIIYCVICISYAATFTYHKKIEYNTRDFYQKWRSGSRSAYNTYKLKTHKVISAYNYRSTLTLEWTD